MDAYNSRYATSVFALGGESYLSDLGNMCLLLYILCKYEYTILPKSLTSFFVDIIPKGDSPLQTGGFGPISRLNSLYKFVAKVLVDRLATFMVYFTSLE